jgi:tight adherence protein B
MPPGATGDVVIAAALHLGGIAAAAAGATLLVVDAVGIDQVRRRTLAVGAGAGSDRSGRAEAGPDAGAGAMARRLLDRFRPLARRLRWLRRSTDVEHALVLEGIARALRGGGSLAVAVDEVVAGLPPGPAVTDLARAAASARSGLPLVDALDRWGRASGPGDDARVLAAAALTLGADLGGSSAQSLDAAAAGLRDRAALGREVRALTSQARASAAVLVVAPLGFVVVAGAADGRVTTTLLTTPVGLVCLVAGVVLDLVGALWMARMTRRAS